MLPPQWLNHPAPLTDIHRGPAHKYIALLTPPPPPFPPVLSEPLGTLLATATDCKAVTGRQRCELIRHSPEGAMRLGSILQISRSWQLQGRAQEKLPHLFLWIFMDCTSLSPQILRIPKLPFTSWFG